jgi:fluoroacetyl-CoA thioesterase
MILVPGLTASAEIVVGDSDTATAMGSGDVPVLATPRLLALAEAATVTALAGHLHEHETSVGTRVQLEHLRATGIGRRVVAHAELVQVDGRLLRFTVRAEDGEGLLLGRGELTRVVVDRERFMPRLDE